MALKKSKSEAASKPSTAAAKTTSAPKTTKSAEPVSAPKAAASKTVAPKAAAAKVAAPKAAAAKVTAPKSSVKPPVAKAAADTAIKAGTPKAAVTKSVPKAAVKAPTPIKLTDKQTEFLKTIHSAGETGYKGDKQAEVKAIDSLLAKKLIKKGSKDKSSGAYHYTVSKAGEKHLSPTTAS